MDAGGQRPAAGAARRSRLLLAFCLCYVALQVLTRWGWSGATRLIGPHPWDWWRVALVPLDFARDAIYEVLRICLLGVAYDLALRRAGPAGGPSGPPVPGEPVTERT